MPIQILQDDERLTHEQAGSKIFYRRLSTLKRSAIVRKHTKRGKPDWPAVTEDILKEVVIGWEKVQVKKKDCPFDIDLVPKLPEDVIGEILSLSGGTGEDEDEAENPEKN